MKFYGLREIVCLYFCNALRMRKRRLDLAISDTVYLREKKIMWDLNSTIFEKKFLKALKNVFSPGNFV